MKTICRRFLRAVNSDRYKQIRHRFLLVARYAYTIILFNTRPKKMWTVRRTSVSNIAHKFPNKLKWCQLKQCSYLEIVKIPNLQPHVHSYGIKVLSCVRYLDIYTLSSTKKYAFFRCFNLKLSRHGHINKIIKAIYAFGCCVLAC